MSLRKLLTFMFILLSPTILLAQPELDIKPNKIVFEDIFSRIDHAYLINKGNSLLTIDSLGFNQDFYLIDFEDNRQLPFTINPDDSVRMNVTLTGFFHVTVTDTMDTIHVYNNGINNHEKLRVKIDFFEDEYGSIYGIVSDGVNPLENTTIYFFYEGVYLLDTAVTSSIGEYHKILPEGDFTIAAEKEGYHVSFYDNTFDPFFAEEVEVIVGDSVLVYFSLQSIIDTSFSVSGEVIDSTGIILIDRGVVVVRKGKHVPDNRPQGSNLTAQSVYAGLVKPDGTYKVFIDTSDYYYIQAYTNYFLPGYFNDEGLASVFWTEGDSVLIDNSIMNKNISLLRDSSYGGGMIGGNITFSSLNPEFDFEGITLLARSLDNNALYSYNFGKESGSYAISTIPYGTYEIVAQKIGLENAVSTIVTIDQINNQFFNIDLSFILSDIENIDLDILPTEIILYPNYPNPFNPSTNISFTLPEATDVELRVSNILGETVKVLLNTFLPAGKYNYNFVASDLASGVYLVTLQSVKTIKTQKIVLMK